MPSNIETFKGNLKFGLSSPARYEVSVVNPASNFSPEVSMMCEECVIPGRAFNTTPLQMFGQAIELPYQSIYAPLVLGFICSGDMYEKRYFDKWNRLILDERDHYLSYLDKYKSDLRIFKYDDLDRLVYTAIFEEAYPKIVQEIPLGYAMTNTYCKVIVTMSYTKWDYEEAGLHEGRVGVSPGGGSGGLPEAPDDVTPA